MIMPSGMKIAKKSAERLQKPDSKASGAGGGDIAAAGLKSNKINEFWSMCARHCLH